MSDEFRSALEQYTIKQMEANRDPQTVAKLVGELMEIERG